MRFSLLSAVVVLSVFMAGCGTSSSAGPKPTATDTGGKVAAGDIPDTAVYLTYKGSGYHLEYVEGWGLHLGPGPDVTISDKDSSETVHIVSGSAGSANIASADLAHLASSLPRFNLVFKRTVMLTPGETVHAQYKTMSPQDPVTGKRVPVIVDRYYMPGPKKHAVITLATPVGVGNIDAFRRIAESFRWV